MKGQKKQVIYQTKMRSPTSGVPLSKRQERVQEAIERKRQEEEEEEARVKELHH